MPAAAAVAAGAAVAVALWPAPSSSPPVTRFALSVSADNTLLLDPQSRDLAITPDGTRVIYKGGTRRDRTQLFLHELDQLDSKPLTGIGMPKGPFTSPDGRWVGFFEPGASPGAVLKRVAIGGGPAQEVSRLDGPSRGSTWGEDDTIIAASGAPATGLLRIPPAGGAPIELTRPNRDRGESDHWWPQFLPGGKSVLFTITALTGRVDDAQVAALDVASGTWKTLIRGASQAQYVASGHLVYVSGGALWAVGFDLTRVETTGTAVVVIPQVVTLPTGVAEFDIARDGTLAYVARGGTSAQPRTLVWVDRQGREEPIPAPARAYANVRLSPDATRVAMEVEEEDQDIWVWHLTRQTLTRVTTDPGLDETPVWMPDGRRLVFTSQTGGALGALFWQAADGGSPAEPLHQGTLIQRASDVLQDGSGLLFSEGTNLMMLSLDKDRRALPLIRGSVGGAGGESAISMDGRWLAYVGIDSRAPQVFVVDRLRPDEERMHIAGGSQPRWARSGRELFYTGLDGTLMSVPVISGATLTTGEPTQVFAGTYFDRSDRALEGRHVRRVAGRPAIPDAQAGRQPRATGRAAHGSRREELDGGIEAARASSPLGYLPRIFWSRNSITVFHEGVNGAGLATAHPCAVVERTVAASRIASSVRKPFHGPCPAFGRLMKTASRHALLSAM